MNLLHIDYRLREHRQNAAPLFETGLQAFTHEMALRYGVTSGRLLVHSDLLDALSAAADRIESPAPSRGYEGKRLRKYAWSYGIHTSGWTISGLLNTPSWLAVGSIALHGDVHPFAVNLASLDKWHLFTVSDLLPHKDSP